MIVASMSIVRACIIQAGEDETYMLNEKGQIPAQSDNCNTDLTVNAACYKQAYCCDKQVDRFNTVKISDLF